MQNVACPIMIVIETERDADGPASSIVVCSARPVMIPGSAIGRITSSVIVSRPKNENRAIASDSERPEPDRDHRRAEPPPGADSQSASRTAGSWYASLNHFVEKLSIGQRCVMLSLNAYTEISTSGR